MTNKEIALAFSTGDFEKIYNNIDEQAVWIIVEENTFTGKSAITENCKQVSSYFKSVTTKFETTNVVSEQKMVVVNGTAEFLKEGNQLSFVSACDIYEFNNENQIQKIISYCIEKSKD